MSQESRYIRLINFAVIQTEFEVKELKVNSLDGQHAVSVADSWQSGN